MPKKADTRPPRTDADEKATLLGFLDYLRGAVVAKVEGLPDPQARAAGVPSGTSLLGLVKHLACVERFTFLGENVKEWNAHLPAAHRRDGRRCARRLPVRRRASQ